MADDPRSPDSSEDSAFVSWDRPDRLVTFGMVETARRAGTYRWISMQLFETLGGWVRTVPEIDVRQRLATHSHHARWHAQLWRDRLPDLAEMAPDDLTAPPDEALRDALVLMADAAGTTSTIEKLTGAYRVVFPRLAAAYTFQLAHTSAVTDSPTVRALTLARCDVMADWLDGEMMIQSLVRTPDDALRAADHQARVEAMVIGAGGICGPGSIG